MLLNNINVMNSFGAKTNTPDGRVERIVTVNLDNGLHCRPAASVIKLTQLTPGVDVFMSPITNPAVKNNVSGSILSLLMLAAGKGHKIVVNVPKNYPPRVYKALIKGLQAKTDADMVALVDKCCANFKK